MIIIESVIRASAVIYLVLLGAGFIYYVHDLIKKL